MAASALLRRGKPHSLERENQGRLPLAKHGEKGFLEYQTITRGNSFFSKRAHLNF